MFTPASGLDQDRSGEARSLSRAPMKARRLELPGALAVIFETGDEFVAGLRDFAGSAGESPKAGLGDDLMAATRGASENIPMPTQSTIKKARRLASRGKRPSTQAGEFVREEMKELKRGSGSVRSRKQAVAIGLSEARRAGVKLPPPKRGKAGAGKRRKARQDRAVGAGRRRPDPGRSRGAKKAAATRERRYGRRAPAARMTRTRRRW